MSCRPSEPLLEEGSVSSAPVTNPLPKRRSLLARLLCCFMGSATADEQAELCQPCVSTPCSSAGSSRSAMSCLPEGEEPLPVSTPAGSLEALHKGSAAQPAAVHILCSAGPTFNLLD